MSDEDRIMDVVANCIRITPELAEELNSGRIVYCRVMLGGDKYLLAKLTIENLNDRLWVGGKE